MKIQKISVTPSREVSWNDMPMQRTGWTDMRIPNRVSRIHGCQLRSVGDFERDLHRPTRTYITINHILLHCCTNCSICFGLVPWVMMALSLQDTCLVRHHPIFIAWRVPNNATHRSGKTQAPQAPKAPLGCWQWHPKEMILPPFLVARCFSWAKDWRCVAHSYLEALKSYTYHVRFQKF